MVTGAALICIIRVAVSTITRVVGPGTTIGSQLLEVWKSVDLGLQLSPIVVGDLTVHVDANPVVSHRSSAYVQELVGLVVGQGFRALIKPDSWAATHAADHLVRASVA